LIRRCVSFVFFFSLARAISLRDPFTEAKLVGSSQPTFAGSSEQWETLLTLGISCVEPSSMLDANGSANQKSKHRPKVVPILPCVEELAMNYPFVCRWMVVGRLVSGMVPRQR
jgi:hypothetical protein